jgi:hypothetical protein
MEEGGGGWRRVEEGGGGWKSVEKGGGVWRSVEEGGERARAHVDEHAAADAWRKLLAHRRNSRSKYLKHDSCYQSL